MKFLGVRSRETVDTIFLSLGPVNFPSIDEHCECSGWLATLSENSAQNKKTCKTIVQQVQFPLGCLNPKVESLCKLLSNN